MFLFWGSIPGVLREGLLLALHREVTPGKCKGLSEGAEDQTQVFYMEGKLPIWCMAWFYKLASSWKALLWRVYLVNLLPILEIHQKERELGFNICLCIAPNKTGNSNSS